MNKSEFQRRADDVSAMAYVKDNRVEGWLTPTAGYVTIALATTIEVKGRPVCEIGVHHGRSAILLGLLARARVVGFDLFERQAENEDESGNGHREIFLRNVVDYGLDPQNVSAVSVNSLQLSAGKVIECCGGRPVLFSVDGGHTEALTLNDLKIAAEAVAEDGVVMLDDVFHEVYPGVVSGLFAFMAERPNTLFPFCIGGGKLFLARSETQAQKLQAVIELFGQQRKAPMGRMATRRFCGRDVLVIVPDAGNGSVRRVLTNTSIWRRVRNTPAGLAVRRTYALLRHHAKLL